MTSIGRCPRAKASKHQGPGGIPWIGARQRPVTRSRGARTRRAISRPSTSRRRTSRTVRCWCTRWPVASPAWVRVRHALTDQVHLGVAGAVGVGHGVLSLDQHARIGVGQQCTEWVVATLPRQVGEAERSAQQLFRQGRWLSAARARHACILHRRRSGRAGSPRAICAAQIEDRHLPGRSAFGNVTSRMEICTATSRTREQLVEEIGLADVPPGDLYRPTPAMLRSAAGRRGGERPRSGSCDRRLSATT